MPHTGMTRRRARGFQHERELVKKLWQAGFAAIRGPASGAKVKRGVQPDVVAIKNGFVVVAEVKTLKKPSTVYIKREQIEKARTFAERAGGAAYVAVKVVGEGMWRFVPVSALAKTRSGNFKLDEDVLVKHSIRLEDLVRMADSKSRRLDEFLPS